MKAVKFDKKFDDGMDIGDMLDASKARKVNEKPQRLNVDFPAWMVESLDREARHIGVSRQAIIKTWIADRLRKPHF